MIKMLIVYYILLTSHCVLGSTPQSLHKIAKKQYVSYNDGESEPLSQMSDEVNGENEGEMNSFAPSSNDIVSSFINNEEGEKLGGDEGGEVSNLGGGGMDFEGGNIDDNGASRHVLESADNGVLNDGDGGNDQSSLSSLLSQGSQDSSQSNDVVNGLSLSADANSSPQSLASSFSDNLNSGGNGDDLLSSLTEDPFGKKFESTVNLGDSVSSQPESNAELGPLDGFKGNSVFDKLLTGGYSLGAGATSQATNLEESKHHSGDAKEGIGNKFEDVQDLLSKELNQLDNADEKLEKMLENGIDSESNAFGNSDGTNSDGFITSGPTGGPITIGGSPSSWGAADTTMSGLQTQMANQYADGMTMENVNQQLTQQAQGANNHNPLGQDVSLNQPIAHKVVHEHASDSQSGLKSGGDNLSLTASQNAANVQMKQKNSHQVKLKKLKTRLNMLQHKLQELTAEQTKKSSSGDENDPRKIRNNAIKRLLIKNLKLAALIASKEIQLEETKARSLSSASERREDSLKANEPVREDNAKFSNQDFLNVSKPLTELSRKAEEEVNHLKKNDQQQTSHEFSKALQKQDNQTLSTAENTSLDPVANKTAVAENAMKINETLAILDKSSNVAKNITENVTATPLEKPTQSLNATSTTSLPKNSTKSVKEILSSFETSPIVVGEKSIASLFSAMKQKAAVTAKRRSLHKRLFRKLKNWKNNLKKDA